MAQFSVLTQPWIPVKGLDGTQKEVGLLNALLNAHTYTGICCESPLEEYSIQRLLIAFLMDAYQPESYRDRRTLYRKGCFDPDIIHNYVALCQSEGVSFDLFDQEAPFMQAKYDESMDKGKEKPVSNIMHTAVTGNNHIHFEHHFETEYSLTYAQALRAMLASYVFCTACKEGPHHQRPSSVNNTPCNYYLCQGETFFQTLVLNMISRLECGNIPWNDPPIAWRDRSPAIPEMEYATVSILAAFTWQPRRITLIEDASNITEVYYQSGKNFVGNGVWMEPHAAFGKSKEEEWSTIKPKERRALWRDVGTVVAASINDVAQYRPPLSSTMYDKIIGEPRTVVPLRVVGLVTDQATLVELQEDTLYLPPRLLSDPELGQWLAEDMNQIEVLAKKIPECYKSLNSKVTVKHKKVEKLQSVMRLTECYFLACHKFLFGNYLPYLKGVDVASANWQEDATKRFVAEMKKVVQEVQHQADKYAGAGKQDLIALVRCNEAFYNSSRKIMK